MTCLFLGLMIATKASLPTFVLVASVIVIYLFYMKDFLQIKKFLFYLPVSILVFLLTYTQYFLLGHNLREFLGLQKWVLNFYESGAHGAPQAVWQILFTGKWPTWWGTLEKVNEWNMLWPLSLIATLYFFYKILLRRGQYKSTLPGFWILIYIIFLNFIPVWPRYLLMILPFMYNLTVLVLSKNLHRLFPAYKPRNK